MQRLNVIPVLLVGCLALAGCASERVKAEARKAKEHKEEYVDYYPTGSNIPIKVPKDQMKTSQSETDRAQEVFREVQRLGSHAETDPETASANAGKRSQRNRATPALISRAGHSRRRFLLAG